MMPVQGAEEPLHYSARDARQRVLRGIDYANLHGWTLCPALTS